MYINAKFKSLEELSVCCIGGGPGTDLVALIIFLQKEMLPPKLHCTIIDKDIQSGRKDFSDKPENFQLEVSYELCDLRETGDLPEGVRKAVSEAHIVTMVTSYSHVHNITRNPTDMPRLKMICEKMAKESILLIRKLIRKIYPT